jgi:phospholipid/cholesterol/gamma-HCH transport system substrate-binding protein
VATHRKDDFLVGLTVLAVAAIVIAAALWVGESERGGGSSRLEARFRDVGNSQVGDALVIRGVRAGQIEAIELADAGWVRVRFAVEPRLPLPPDPVVLLGSASLFGEWQATVLDRSALPTNAEVREAIEEASGEDGVMPGATLPDLEQLTAAAGRIAGDVATLADRAQTAFDDSAAAELRATIRSVRSLAAELESAAHTQARALNAMSAELRTGIGSANASAASLERALARVDSATAGGEVAAVVTDARAAAAQLRATTAELQLRAERLAVSQGALERLLARLDTTAARINGRDGSLGRLVNDPSLYANSDSLVVELRALVADVRANPQRYVSLRIF